MSISPRFLFCSQLPVVRPLPKPYPIEPSCNTLLHKGSHSSRIFAGSGLANHRSATPVPLRFQAARSTLASRNAPSTAFARCSGPICTPSAMMISRFVMPMKPKTARR